jgi:hypothetical protein
MYLFTVSLTDLKKLENLECKCGMGIGDWVQITSKMDGD